MVPNRFTRRGFLRTAAGVVALAAVGEGVSLAVDRPPAAQSRTPRFRSRPDLNPPPIDVLRPVDGAPITPGLIMLSAARTNRYGNGPLIVNNNGDLMWFHQVEHGATNVQVQTYKGQPILCWWEGLLVEPAGYGSGKYAIFGTDYKQVAEVQAHNGLAGDLHEFIITPQGTALFTAYTPLQNYDLSAVGGPHQGTLLDSVCQEVDIETGELLFEWRASHHVAVDESFANVPKTRTTEWDFFHINSIDVDDDGNLLISGRDVCALYKVDRRSGEVIWRLGGAKSDFTMEPNTRFYYQHHARHHGNSVITLFDDGAGLSNVEQQSRGLKLTIDEKAKAVRFAAEFLPDPSVLATSQGSMQLLPDGGAFVGWGNEPYFSEYGPSGQQRFNAKLEAGSNSYRAFRSQWVGSPTAPPDVALDRRGAESVDVYVSWNGSTEVASWDVLAGDSPTSLETIATAERRAFETTFRLTSPATYFAVQGRDGSGAILGASAAQKA